jgi:hypothetical protein
MRATDVCCARAVSHALSEEHTKQDDQHMLLCSVLFVWCEEQSTFRRAGDNVAVFIPTVELCKCFCVMQSQPCVTYTARPQSKFPTRPTASRPYIARSDSTYVIEQCCSMAHALTVLPAFSQ